MTGLLEASLSRDEPPCWAACPLHTDARGYLILTSAGRFEEAYRVAAASNPLPSTCGRACSAQCEAACRRRELDRPVAIRRIKRFLSDRFADQPPPQRQTMAPTGKSVAIIGCGPAGLTAAHDLALQGHRVTIFDAAGKPGGTAALGVPGFRLPAAELERDIAEIRRLGVNILTATRVGQHIGLSGIRASFDAVFIAAGAFQPNTLEVPGARLHGVLLALPWLHQVNLTGHAACGNRVVVVGGGYTAMDAARTALRMGARHVSIVYRRTRQEMEVHDEELEETVEEGVAIHYLASPVRFLSTDRRSVSSAEFIRNKLGDLDESGRRRPVAIPGSEFVIKADTIIAAVGQRPDVSFADDSLDTVNGVLEVDPETLQTSAPGLFAGGDYIRGSGTIVDAMADGRRAARSIHRHLGFQAEGDPTRTPSLCPLTLAHLYEGVWLSRKPPLMPKTDIGQRRKQLYVEVEPPLDEDTAVAEALRCLYCGLQPQISPDECSLCRACLGICPTDCIRMLAQAGGDGRPVVWTDSAKEAIGFAIDEERCIRCGQCARVCPTEAISFPALAASSGTTAR